MGTAKLDGLCSWSDDGRPHVLLASDKASFPRRQMDAAHEMAHAVLHRNVSDDELRTNLKEIERQAFRLASAFLLPSDTYPIEVKAASLATFLVLKERWRVSIKAQIKRFVDLELLDVEASQQLYKLYSAKGWTREEPMDRQWPLQTPSVLSQALHLIVDSGTRRKADLLATEFTMMPGDIENLCNLPPGWLSRDSAEVVRLKEVPGVNGERRNKEGTVVPFPKSS
jgi:Zn-dependent peptidase ImmA (M78 family)